MVTPLPTSMFGGTYYCIFSQLGFHMEILKVIEVKCDVKLPLIVILYLLYSVCFINYTLSNTLAMQPKQKNKII